MPIPISIFSQFYNLFLNLGTPLMVSNHEDYIYIYIYIYIYTYNMLTLGLFSWQVLKDELWG